MDGLPRQHDLDLGQELGELRTQVGHNPLPHDGGKTGGKSIRLGSRPQAADDSQPGVPLLQERALTLQQRLLLKGYEDLRRVALQCFAIEAGGRDADDCEWMAIQHEARADDFGIGRIFLLPRAVAEHGGGRCRGLVIGGFKRAACKRLNAEGSEVVAGDELTAQRLGQLVGLSPAHAVLRPGGLKSRQLFKFGRGDDKALIKLVRKQSPVILRAALDAAIIAVAHTIESSRIRYRQRLQHDGVNKREDCSRCADPQGERKHSG